MKHNAFQLAESSQQKLIERVKFSAACVVIRPTANRPT
jgi:hypothetical protein